jgi:hypothetical protein
MSKDGRASIHAPREGLNSFFSREVFEILLTGQICGCAEGKFASLQADWERFPGFKVFLPRPEPFLPG